MNEGLAATASAALSKQAKAAAKKDIRRALKPATAPVKKGLHKARKWFDKATSKVPVLGKFASLPLDVADDLVGGILPEVKSKRIKWMKPEFVDSLPEVKTARQMVIEPNPGPGKKRSHAKKRSGGRGTRKRNKLLLKYSGIRVPRARALKVSLPRRNVRAKAVRYRNKRTGKVQEGYKMVTSEYALGFDYAGTSQMGDELIEGGLLMNPHELKLPELNIEVQRWEYFRIRPVVTLDGASVQNVDAAIHCYFDPDPTDLLSSDGVKRIEVSEAHGGAPHKVTTMKATWKPNAKRGANVKFTKWFHCDSAGQTGADLRLQNQFRFRMLCYRPPKTYWNGTPTPIDIPMNMRVRYEIDFKVRTLDNVSDDSVQNGIATSFHSTAPHFTTTDAIGLYTATSAQLSSYVVDSVVHNTRRYIFGASGGNAYLDRISDQGRPVPRYLFVGINNAAISLIGISSMNSALGNLTNLATGSTGLGGNTNNNAFNWMLLKVTDTRLQTPTSYDAAHVSLQGAIFSKLDSTQTLNNVWRITFGNFSTVGTPTDVNVCIMELDEGPGVSKLAWFGPATVQGLAYKQWSTAPNVGRPTFAEFVRKFKEKRDNKFDELDYWKRKAQDRQYEKKEYKEHKLSLTPTPSDDEEDWLAFQQQRAAMHKSPGVIGMKPLKIVQDDEKSERGAPRPKAGSQK